MTLVPMTDDTIMDPRSKMRSASRKLANMMPGTIPQGYHGFEYGAGMTLEQRRSKGLFVGTIRRRVGIKPSRKAQE